MRIRKKYGRKTSMIILLFYALVALLAPLLANEKPILVTIGGETYYPAISGDVYIELPDEQGMPHRMRTSAVDWKNIHADRIIFAPVTWSPVKSDLANILASPFDEQYDDSGNPLPGRFRHLLGTGKLGNDVLAGLIHGCRTSMAIGIVSMLIALAIGILMGGFAGFFGDNEMRIKRSALLLITLLIIPAWFYGFHMRMELLSRAFQASFLQGTAQLIISITFSLVILLWPLLLNVRAGKWLNHKIRFPVDTMISKTTEIFISLPRLVLILAIAAFFHSSILSIILIIGLTSWTEFSRMMRAQVLQLKTMTFTEAAKMMGIRTNRIIALHLLPNAWPQMRVLLTIGVASAILVETSLSFLGIGVPAGVSTWGSLMFEARENYQAWWLIVFTGGAIFLIISALLHVGNAWKSRSNAMAH